MIKTLKTVATVLKDKYFIVFALFWGMLYFTQLYAKLGYLATGFMFKGQETIAYLSAAVFGLFAGTANTALIIGNKSDKGNISLQIMLFDVAISFFFYGGVFIEAYNTGSAKDIGTAIGTVIMGVYSSYLIFRLSESFRTNNLEEDRVLADTYQLQSNVRTLVANCGIALPNGSETIEQMVNLVADNYRLLADEKSLVANEVETLRPLSEEVVMLEAKLKQISQEKDEMSNKVKEFLDIAKREKEEANMLRDKLQEVQSQADRLDSTNKLRAEKAALTRLINNGEYDRAESKKQEIEQKFGITITDISIPV